jgi:hypothetical protein
MERDLASGLAQLQRAEVRIALLAIPRGEALRLVERVPGFDLVILGDGGAGTAHERAAPPPVLIGQTLVVEGPNHLRAVIAVDFHGDPDGAQRWEEGSGLRERQERSELEARRDALSLRLRQWRDAGVSGPDIRARERELEEVENALGQLRTRPPRGAWMRATELPVGERFGADAQVGRLMQAYYRRVNEHNRLAFANRKPEPAPEGSSHYVGGGACANCHEAAQAFWSKTRHASAYATLESRHVEFNLECVGCHVTGYEKPGGSTVTHVEGLTNVQCEACHGPGSRHVEAMGERALITKTPAKGLCGASCHYPPHVSAQWSVEHAWGRILGPGHGEPPTAKP